MDTKDLRCFCRVYEERGINQAAKQLFISPQGLSRIIAKLEAEYEIPKDDNIGEVTITREYIEHTGGPRITMRGVRALPDARMAGQG